MKIRSLFIRNNSSFIVLAKYSIFTNWFRIMEQELTGLDLGTGLGTNRAITSKYM